MNHAMNHTAKIDLSGYLPQSTARPRLGEILVDMDSMLPEDIERVLTMQSAGGKRLCFGEAAVVLGVASQHDVQQALLRQFGGAEHLPARISYPSELIAAQEPMQEQLGVLQSVRSQLASLWFARGHKALGVASLHSGDGASFLAANLALLFAQLGESTLLVDANLHRPRQHEIFCMERGPGLSDVLAQRAGLEIIEQAHGYSELWLMQAGTVPPNPHQLLGGRGFAALLDALCARYDVVLLDVPSMDLGIDGLNACANAKAGMLLCTRRADLRVADVKAVNECVERAGVQMVAAVMTDFDGA